MRIDVLTTFPEMFGDAGALGSSVPARARAAGVVQWHATNIRDYSKDKHARTDDRPFGGGPGMVMMCQPLWDAVVAAEALDARPATRILMSPQGRVLDQALVEDLARMDRLLIVCGHYEGIDERVVQRLDPLEVSIGDYVVSSGEIAALVLMDAVIRLLPGALGAEDSALQDSFARLGERSRNAPGEGPGADARLLDCPHYTRPRLWEGMGVPDVLVSGDHERVAAWRLEQMLRRTSDRRPDLLDGGRHKDGAGE